LAAINPSNPEQSQRSAQQSNPHPFRDPIVWATLGIFLATAFSVGVGYLQRETLEKTDKTLRAGQRAFVNVNDVRMEPTPKDVDNMTYLTIGPILENSGSTAVRNGFYYLGWSISGLNNTVSPPFPIGKVESLTPAQGMPINLGPHCKQDFILSSLGIGDGALDSVRNMDNVIYIFGRVSYTDVFKACHITEFCFTIGRESPHNNRNRISAAFCNPNPNWPNCTDEDCPGFKPC
jgi:hypothetical protein